MKTKTKNIKKTRAQLEYEILELQATSTWNRHEAYMSIDKLSEDYLMASGVIIHMQKIGGGRAICPVLISNGLSKETIQAIKNDIMRSQIYSDDFNISKNRIRVSASIVGNDKVKAIKEVRTETGFNLKVAKEFVEGKAMDFDKSIYDELIKIDCISLEKV